MKHSVDGDYSSLFCQRSKVSPYKARGEPRHLGEIQFLGKSHLSCQDLQYPHSGGRVWDGETNLSVKAPSAPQRWIERVRAVRCTDDEYRLSLRVVESQGIHACEQLRDDATLHPPSSRFPLGRDGVNFINEDEARSLLNGLSEEVPDALL